MSSTSKIDVLISSCARPDILDACIKSFIKHAKSKLGFRLVICEDLVSDPERQKLGAKWISNHKFFFDKIIFSKTKLTYVFCFSEILKYAKSKYFIRLEDDVEFFEEIDCDKIIDCLKRNENICQFIFRRQNMKLHPQWSCSNISDCGTRKLYSSDFCSIASGVYNTKLIRQIVDYSGTNKCHESKVLTPSMKALNFKGGVIEGLNSKEAIQYVGDNLGYKKGSWKR